MRIERYTDGTFKKKSKVNLPLRIVSLVIAVAFIAAAGQTTGEAKADEGIAQVCVSVEKPNGGDLGLQVCASTEAELLKLVPDLVEEQMASLKENMVPREERDKTIIKTLKQVCADNNVANPDCARHLYGMAKHESIMGKRMVGDNGQSHGWFHIMYYHHVGQACSHDLECSADWTLKRMIRNGYNENSDNAIRLHNGSLSNPKTAEYLKAIKSKMY